MSKEEQVLPEILLEHSRGMSVADGGGAPVRGEKGFRELKIRLAMAVLRETRAAAEARVRRQHSEPAPGTKGKAEKVAVRSADDFFAN